jgi:small subunit ribosomal protein S14
MALAAKGRGDIMGALSVLQSTCERGFKPACGEGKQLRYTYVDPKASAEDREAARLGLQKLPRNASPVRVRGRDAIDGRPRGFLSKFGISRVRFREMAHRGELPGVKKSSW